MNDKNDLEKSLDKLINELAKVLKLDILVDYLSDVIDFIKKYGGEKWYKNKVFIGNALYVNAPGRWKRYNKLLCKIFK